MKNIPKKQRKNNEFWKTVLDIRNITSQHMVQSKAKTFKIKNSKRIEKGAKIPLKILNQVRKKAITTLKQEKEKHRTEDIQYESLARTKDTKFLEKIKQTKLKNHGTNYLKNKYKFKDMKSKSMGTFKNGALQFSAKEVERIKGKRKK